MWGKCKNGTSSFFPGIASCLYKCTTSTDMIIDDDDFPTVKIPSLEVHFYLGRRFSYLRTGDYLIVFEKSGKCFLGSCIGKEDDRFFSL